MLLFSFSFTEREDKAKMQSYRSIEQLEALAGRFKYKLQDYKSIINYLSYQKDRRERFINIWQDFF